MRAVGFRNPWGGGGSCKWWLIEVEDSLTKPMAVPLEPPGDSMMSSCPRRSAKIDIGSRTRDKAMGQRYFDTAFRNTCAATLLWVGCFHYCPVVLKKSVVWIWMMQKDWKELRNMNYFVSRW